jgi:hypothetical protein
MSKYIVIGLIVVVAAGAYASRDTLKTYFETGDVPTQEKFSDTIDSTLHMEDDGMSADQKTYTPTKDYQAKVLTEAQTEFKLDAPQPVTFRWKSAPTTGEAVTYRLKVWQLMQGQSGTQAMRSNQPIVTKDVADVSEVTVSSIYTGPCRPPYLCDFVWSVDVVAPASTGAASGAVAEPSTGTR